MTSRSRDRDARSWSVVDVAAAARADPEGAAAAAMSVGTPADRPCRDLAGLGVDARDRLVLGVEHPDRALADGDVARRRIASANEAISSPSAAIVARPFRLRARSAYDVAEQEDGGDGAASTSAPEASTSHRRRTRRGRARAPGQRELRGLNQLGAGP